MPNSTAEAIHAKLVDLMKRRMAAYRAEMIRKRRVLTLARGQRPLFEGDS